jgi:hypothetical protein
MCIGSYPVWKHTGQRHVNALLQRGGIFFPVSIPALMASVHVAIESLWNVLSLPGSSPILAAADQFENLVQMGIRGLIVQ